MIKGRATIQLFDEKTGEVVHELHEENMITNAVDTILNPPDYIEIGMDSDNDRSFNMLRDFVGNISDTAFRGVIVCRDKIPVDERGDRSCRNFKYQHGHFNRHLQRKRKRTN